MNRMTITWAILVLPLPLAKAVEMRTRPVSWEPRVVVAKNLSPVGNLLVNGQPGQPWRTLGSGADVHSRDLLLALPGIQAKIETSPRAVELTLWGNLPKMSDFHGLQTAVILHDSRSFDLDFTLRRGRVLITNRKESGPARVWLRVEGAAFQLTLSEPGDAICLGLYGHWPRGVRFSVSPKAEDVPVRSLNLEVVKGQVDVKVNGASFGLSAPPGLASFHWDSANGSDAAPQQRRQLDSWADPSRESPAEAKPLLDAIAKYQAAVKDKEPRTALFDLLDAAARGGDGEEAKAMAEFAVLGLAAMNDLDRVMQALDDSNQVAARKSAVIALRHWIGDDAGRDRLLYQYLIDRLNYPKSQAATVLQLLHNALPAEEPETYETLIAYLRHEKLAIRELAWWHLSRLVPEDILLPYNPAAPAEERAKVYAAWKELIPSGSLPARKAKK